MAKPIPVSQANAMIKTYDSYMENLGVDMKGQTHCVAFSLTELMNWLNKMTPIADEIRIFMGDYPDGQPNAGRTSVVLWPFKDGKPARTTDPTLATEPAIREDGDPGDPGDPADPFNEGDLKP